MKKIYFTLFILLTSNLIFSQAYKPLLKESKTWDVDIGGYDPGNQTPWCWATPTRAFVKGDTIVDGLAYIKLNYYDLDRPCIPNPIGGSIPRIFDTVYTFSQILLREDTASRKVWARTVSDTSEHLIYDFSVNVGDTMKTTPCFQRFEGSTPFFASNNCNDLISHDNRKVLIDSIGLITLDNGEVTRIFYGTTINYFSLNGLLVKTIEGVGGPDGLTNPFFDGFEWDKKLVCVQDSGEFLFTTGYCGYFVGTEEYNINNFDFKMFPNPNNGNNITITGDELEKVEFYNIHGQQIKSILVKNDNAIVKLNNQPKGIYLVKTHFKNGTVSAKKLIIK